MRDAAWVYLARLLVCAIFWITAMKMLGFDPFSPSIFVDIFERAFFGE